LNNDERFTMRYWGVRGSIPTPGPKTVRYGGNTSCIEVRCGDTLLIVDGGTGLRALGEAFVASGARAAHVFFTHYHWDHIQGFPFFSPIYDPRNRFVVHGPSHGSFTCRSVLDMQMAHPAFPITLDTARAEMEFAPMQAGEDVEIEGGIRIETGALNHPGGSLGVRIHYRGRSVAHITDTEHLHGGVDPEVARLFNGADYANYDASYTDDEYHGRVGPSRRGWGHSTWEEAVRIAEEAGLRNLVLFHHDHTHDDATLDGIHAAACARFPNTLMAMEGMEIDVVTGAVTLPEHVR
jgi:phosphoribosyl 1,2-cyclic phosphodiesterase